MDDCLEKLDNTTCVFIAIDNWSLHHVLQQQQNRFIKIDIDGNGKITSVEITFVWE